MAGPMSTSIQHIQYIRSPFSLIDGDDSKTMPAQQTNGDESKIDLTTHHYLLQPTKHSYKRLEYQVNSLITDDSIGMPTMIDRCYEYYQGYEPELVAIRCFAQQYRSTDAVHWFTKDTFLYRFVNKLLRLSDIELFHNMRFYITHLSTQLAELKCKQKDLMKGVTIVYRGLRQSTEELEALKKLIGTVVITKGFMSTSLDRLVALFFAGVNQPQSAESQSLLVELTIDFNSPSVVAAYVGHLSNFPDEREVLFDDGTEFFVETLTFDSLNNIWLCKLYAPVDTQFSLTAPSTAISIEAFSTKLDAYKGKEAAVHDPMQFERRHKFGSHGTRSKQKELWCTCRTLPWIASSSIDLARIYHQKGIQSWQQGEMNKAATYLERAVALYEQKLADNLEFAYCHGNLGFILYKIGEYIRAIDFAKQSLAICLRVAPSEQLIHARYYRVLGLAYLAVDHIEDALECHNQALIIDKKLRPTAKWSMALTLRNFALIHRSRSDKVRATEYYRKALNTFREVCTDLLEFQ